MPDSPSEILPTSENDSRELVFLCFRIGSVRTMLSETVCTMHNKRLEHLLEDPSLFTHLLHIHHLHGSTSWFFTS